MDLVLGAYILLSVASLFCTIVGCKFLLPKNHVYLTTVYLGFLVFFTGRVYEVSRLLIGLDIYNTFELGSIGITGAFCFWLSSNIKIKELIKVPNINKYKGISIVIALLSYIAFGISLYNNPSITEGILDFAMMSFASANIFFYSRYLFLMKDDESGILRSLKMYHIFSFAFCVSVLFLLVAFAINSTMSLFVAGTLISISMILSMIFFKKGVKGWRV